MYGQNICKPISPMCDVCKIKKKLSNFTKLRTLLSQKQHSDYNANTCCYIEWEQEPMHSLTDRQIEFQLAILPEFTAGGSVEPSIPCTE